MSFFWRENHFDTAFLNSNPYLLYVSLRIPIHVASRVEQLQISSGLRVRQMNLTATIKLDEKRYADMGEGVCFWWGIPREQDFISK